MLPTVRAFAATGRLLGCKLVSLKNTGSVSRSGRPATIGASAIGGSLATNALANVRENVASTERSGTTMRGVANGFRPSSHTSSSAYEALYVVVDACASASVRLNVVFSATHIAAYASPRSTAAMSALGPS